MFTRICLARFLLIIIIVILSGACQNDKIETGFVHESPFDSTRLVKVQLSSDLDEPMEIVITPDNKVVITERKGTIKLYHPLNNSTTVIARLNVYTGQEDGLLGAALDPQYATNHFIYLYYSPAGEKPVQRVSRFIFQNDSIDLSSEKVVIEIPTQRQECCHSAGSLAFGPGGNLFIAAGDNTNPHNIGYYNSIDEREGRANWDAQRSAGNTNDLRGKILRIHPEADGSYSIPEGNLFAKGTDSSRPEIYVMGSRNPYRIGVDPKKGWLYWGDVGQNTIDNPARGPISYDEWNLATTAGFFGWPYFAGPNAAYADFDFATLKTGPFFDSAKPVNNSVNNTGLSLLPPARSALIWYSYDESTLFPHLGTGGKSPIGGPVFYTEIYRQRISDTSTHLHEHFNGKVFIAEWMRDWINVLTVNDNGKLDSIETFMRGTKFNHPIDLEFGPDGTLYVLEYGTYWFSKNKDAGLYRIQYLRGNRSPSVQLNASKNAGELPLTIQFSAKGSVDPDSSQISFKWYFDSVAVQSTEMVTTHTFTRPGKYKVRLEVADSDGKVQEKFVEITAGNAEPEIDISIIEGNKTFYFEGKPIRYSVNITDKEDGSLKEKTIDASDAKISLAYTTMGTDLALVAQSHEEVTLSEPEYPLIKASDCKACHAMNDKSVGPSYISISEKYTNDYPTAEKLGAKIISGGSGVWGEYAMSAHPQFSRQQATEIAAYILSLKDEATQSKPVSAEGTFTPKLQPKDKSGGLYYFSASYTDKAQPDVGSNLVRKQYYLRSSRLWAVAYDASKGAARTDDMVVKFSENDSYILFRQTDLTGIRSLSFELDPTHAKGELSIRLGSANGQKIGSIPLDSLQKSAPNVKPLQKFDVTIPATTGMQDIYVVFKKDPSSTGTKTNFLLLDAIIFRQ